MNHLAKKVNLLCVCMWEAAKRYAESTGSPAKLGFLVHIWAGFYYSIFDIVKANNLESVFDKQFAVTTRKFFSISLFDAKTIASIRRTRNFVLDELQASNIDALTADGLETVHDVVLMLHDLYMSEDPEPHFPDFLSFSVFLEHTANILNLAVQLFPGEKASAPAKEA